MLLQFFRWNYSKFELEHFQSLQQLKIVFNTKIFHTGYIRYLYSQNGSCLPNFETLIRNFELKVRNSKSKLQKNFQIILVTFTLKLCLFFKFGVINASVNFKPDHPPGQPLGIRTFSVFPGGLPQGGLKSK